MRPTQDQDRIEKETAEQLIAETPLMEGLDSITVELRDDHTGDPSMWLVFHVKSELQADVPWIKRFTDYSDRLSMSMIKNGLTRFPYTRMERAA